MAAGDFNKSTNMSVNAYTHTQARARNKSRYGYKSSAGVCESEKKEEF